MTDPISPEAIVNQAIDLAGFKRHIGSIWEGSRAARVAINAFSETRDEILTLRPWSFARVRYALVADTSIPARWPWTHRWTFPVDALVLLDVMPNAIDISASDEVVPYFWQEDGEQDKRVIQTSFTPAAAIVTSKFINITQWPPDFTALVIQSLAQKMARALAGAPQKEAQGGEGNSRQ